MFVISIVKSQINFIDSDVLFLNMRSIMLIIDLHPENSDYQYRTAITRGYRQSNRQFLIFRSMFQLY